CGSCCRTSLGSSRDDSGPEKSPSSLDAERLGHQAPVLHVAASHGQRRGLPSLAITAVPAWHPATHVRPHLHTTTEVHTVATKKSSETPTQARERAEQHRDAVAEALSQAQKHVRDLEARLSQGDAGVTAEELATAQADV